MSSSQLTALARIAKANERLAAAQRHLADVIGRARAEGATWQQIGDVLGCSRQAAHERFSDVVA